MPCWPHWPGSAFDEEAYLDSRLFEPGDVGFERFLLTQDIQASLRGQFLPALGNQGHHIRFDPKSDLNDLFGVGHLQIEPGLDHLRSTSRSRSWIWRRSSLSGR